MNRAGLLIVVAFGLSIGLLLILLQLARVLWWPPRPLDVFPALVGLLFLFVGTILGARLHRSRTAPAQSPPALDTVADDLDDADAASPLSRRERQVLSALAEGCSNAEIARRHFVSENTVKTQVRQICSKLEVSRRGQAVARARQIGLLS